VLLLLFSVVAYTSSSFLSEAKESHWAILVAGSNGWWNYRHQSDTCHAYQILIKNGMPASRIITLAYDDIADDYNNPFPGKIFNKPDPKGPGVDVYAGCALDYTSNDVNPEVFLNVLKGDADAVKGKGTGRVLKASPEDKVFVYFTDHGATGLIAFPNGMLYANDLIDTLKTMHENKSYKRLVFYLEACESGSMFNQILPADWEIYATTAANERESSWATYCSPDDKINGKSVGSCLGDEYSVNWMEDTEGAEAHKNLQKQFEDIKLKTKGSHVMQYGIVDWAKDEELRNYQGDVAESKSNKHKKNKSRKYKAYLDKARKSKVDSRDTKLHYLKQQHLAFGTEQTFSAVQVEENYRKNVEDFFAKFNDNFAIKTYLVDHIIHFDCLKRTVTAMQNSCPALWGEYTLKYVKNLYTACELTHNTEAIEEYIKSSC